MHYLVAITVALAYGFLASIWVRQIGGACFPGIKRLAAISPIVFLNCLVPFVFGNTNAQIIGRMVLGYYTMWLSTFKIVAYALNRGPLVSNYDKYGREWSMLDFSFIFMLPIMPMPVSLSNRFSNGKDKQWKDKELVRLFIILAGKFAQGMYGHTGLFLDACCMMAVGFRGIKCVDSFNYPFAAPTVTEFWGRRWNLMTGRVLILLSQDFLTEGSIVAEATPRKETRSRMPFWKMALGIQMVFVLSGIMHELLFWYSLQIWDGRWFLYFSSCGLQLLLERVVVTMVKDVWPKASVPYLLALTYNAVFSTAIAAAFFVPQAEDAGAKHLCGEIHSYFWHCITWIAFKLFCV